jgi:hypothetical protein
MVTQLQMVLCQEESGERKELLDLTYGVRQLGFAGSSCRFDIQIASLVLDQE